jgi:hypothetical protein
MRTNTVAVQSARANEDETLALAGELSFEDVEAMLQIVLLLAVVTLTFTVPLLTSISRDDLIAAVASISNEYVWKLSWGISLLVFSMFVACFLYLSALFSSAREDSVYMTAWFTWGKWVVALAYVLYCIGLFCTISAATVAVGILFPPEPYPEDNPGHDDFNDAQSMVNWVCTIGSGFALGLSAVVIGVLDLRTRIQYRQDMRSTTIRNEQRIKENPITYSSARELKQYQCRLAQAGLTDEVVRSFLQSADVEPSLVLPLFDAILKENGITKAKHRLPLLAAMLQLQANAASPTPMPGIYSASSKNLFATKTTRSTKPSSTQPELYDHAPIDEQPGIYDYDQPQDQAVSTQALRSPSQPQRLAAGE